MESATGTITWIENGVATVVVEAQNRCKRCESGRGCGAALIGIEQTRQLKVGIPARMSLQRGDHVRLTVSPRHLLRAALLAYGLPLASLLVFSGAAWVSGVVTTDIAAFVFAAAGLGIGLVGSRRILGKGAACEQFLPEIDGIADEAGR